MKAPVNKILPVISGTSTLGAPIKRIGNYISMILGKCAVCGCDTEYVQWLKTGSRYICQAHINAFPPKHVTLRQYIEDCKKLRPPKWATSFQFVKTSPQVNLSGQEYYNLIQFNHGNHKDPRSKK